MEKVMKVRSEKENNKNLLLFSFYYLIRSTIWDFRLPTRSIDQTRFSRGKSWLYLECLQTTFRACFTGLYHRLTRMPTAINGIEPLGLSIEGWFNT